MQEMKNRTSDVAQKLNEGPVILMNRAMIVSPKQWNAIVDKLEEMQDALITLQAELAIAAGQSQVETIDDGAAFVNEVMGTDEPLPT